MTNNDVVTMMNSGIMAISSRALPLNFAYEVTKFKGFIDKAYKAWDEAFQKLPAENEIPDGKAFDKRLNELREKESKKEEMTQAEIKELADLDAKFDRLVAMRKKLNDEEVKVSSKPMPYETWIELKEANKGIKVGNAECLELVESKLEGILWKAPEEEEMAQAEQK